MPEAALAIRRLFAHRVAPGGKVYAIEFIPGNLAILRRNLELNPNYGPLVEIVENAVWEESGQKLYATDNGPGSRVASEPGKG